VCRQVGVGGGPVIFFRAHKKLKRIGNTGKVGGELENTKPVGNRSSSPFIEPFVYLEGLAERGGRRKKERGPT